MERERGDRFGDERRNRRERRSEERGRPDRAEPAVAAPEENFVPTPEQLWLEYFYFIGRQNAIHQYPAEYAALTASGPQGPNVNLPPWVCPACFRSNVGYRLACHYCRNPVPQQPMAAPQPGVLAAGAKSHADASDDDFSSSESSGSEDDRRRRTDRKDRKPSGGEKESFRRDREARPRR